MDDLISRQAAIDTAKTMYDRCDTGEMEDYRDLIVSCFEVLPSAQPEVIRCKDCVNHVDDRCLAANHHTGDTEYCMEVFGAKMKGEQP